MPGISECCTALKQGIVKLNACCENAIKEFGLYSWDEKSGEDRPIKENDHFLDSFRYVCFTLGWVRGPVKLIGQR